MWVRVCVFAVWHSRDKHRYTVCLRACVFVYVCVCVKHVCTYLLELGIFIKTLSHFCCRHLMLLLCIIQATAAAFEQTHKHKDKWECMSVCVPVAAPTGSTNRWHTHTQANKTKRRDAPGKVTARVAAQEGDLPLSLGLTFVYNVVEPKFDSPIIHTRTHTHLVFGCVCVCECAQHKGSVAASHSNNKRSRHSPNCCRSLTDACWGSNNNSNNSNNSSNNASIDRQ